ncbi:MAG: alpha/beta fold hydrolase [Pseudobacteriovorax sp.]|nr:alpha/beta fold hydrolase [Pseudobacteriovorax sp.]
MLNSHVFPFVEESLEASDGIDIFCRYKSITSPDGVVLVIHGFGENQALYEGYGEMLSQQNLAPYFIDLRGHGKTPGEKGQLASTEQVLDDLELIVARIETHFPNKPIIGMGHEVGAVYLARFVQSNKRKFAGLFLSRIPWHWESTSTQRTMKPLLRMFGPVASHFLPKHDEMNELSFSMPVPLLDVIEIEADCLRLVNKADEIYCSLFLFCGKLIENKEQQFFDSVCSFSKEIVTSEAGLNGVELQKQALDWFDRVIRAELAEKRDGAIETSDDPSLDSWQ